MELTGYNLTLDALKAIVDGKEKVSISPQAKSSMAKARQIVLAAVDSDEAIYGLNTSVGKNKDIRIPKNELEDFNRQLIYAHCVGIEPELSIEKVRAAMLIRLNGLIKGYAGVQIEMADLLVDFLNYGVTPVVNGRGSVGEGDIGILSYIGLGLIGEGLIDYQGERYQAADVFQKLGLKPIRLYAKDGLGIISSNAVSFSKICLLIKQLENLLKWFDLAYALSLEALNGNVTPLDDSVLASKNLTGQIKSALHIKTFLKGSYLLKKQSRTVQDPLSFRNVPLIHGAVYDCLLHTKDLIFQELQASDDNPMVDIANKRVISTPNFETLSISLSVEMLKVALSHLSRASVQRVIKLGNPDFTTLSRFLRANDKQYFGLQALQKTAATLDIEIHHASQILSNISYPLAGEMEDRQTNLPLVIQEAEAIFDKLYELLAIELLYACQAISLRFSDKKPLGKGTQEIYDRISGRYGIIEDVHQLYAIVNGISKELREQPVRFTFE